MEPRYDATQQHEAQHHEAQQHEAQHGSDDWLAGATVEIGQEHPAEQLVVSADQLPAMPEHDGEHDQLA